MMNMFVYMGMENLQVPVISFNVLLGKVVNPTGKEAEQV